MPLSVLRTPLDDGTYMLIDTTTDKVLSSGSEDDMYIEKHLIEEAEQQEANQKWMAELFAKRLRQAEALMKSNRAAINILIKKMPEYHSAWLKYKDIF